jgi:hypothetical protein
VTRAATAAAALSRWRPGPLRLVQLLVGLWLFGTGEALLVHAELGVSPWTVLAQGVAVQTPLGIGPAVQAAVHRLGGHGRPRPLERPVSRSAASPGATPRRAT